MSRSRGNNFIFEDSDLQKSEFSGTRRFVGNRRNDSVLSNSKKHKIDNHNRLDVHAAVRAEVINLKDSKADLQVTKFSLRKGKKFGKDVTNTKAIDSNEINKRTSSSTINFSLSNFSDADKSELKASTPAFLTQSKTGSLAFTNKTRKNRNFHPPKLSISVSPVLKEEFIKDEQSKENCQQNKVRRLCHVNRAGRHQDYSSMELSNHISPMLKQQQTSTKEKSIKSEQVKEVISTKTGVARSKSPKKLKLKRAKPKETATKSKEKVAKKIIQKVDATKQMPPNPVEDFDVDSNAEDIRLFEYLSEAEESSSKPVKDINLFDLGITEMMNLKEDERTLPTRSLRPRVPTKNMFMAEDSDNSSYSEEPSPPRIISNKQSERVSKKVVDNDDFTDKIKWEMERLKEIDDITNNYELTIE